MINCSVFFRFPVLLTLFCLSIFLFICSLFLVFFFFFIFFLFHYILCFFVVFFFFFFFQAEDGIRDGRVTGVQTCALPISEVPRVVRLVRSIVLSVREEPYVEAAICAGTPTHLLLFRHILPNTIPALIVQGTFVAASAILLEAVLSFLGIGIPPETPTWGNIMAEGRGLFRIYPHNIFFPGICLALTVLAVNVLGDGLRDRLDPKLARRV